MFKWSKKIGCLMLGLMITILSFPAAQAEDVNIAQGKTVTASGQNGNNGPAYAVDGNVTNTTYWDGPKIGTPQWLKVDLGGAATLSKIELYPVTSPDYASTRRNFEIQGSNDSEFQSYDVLGKQDATSFSISSIFAINSFGQGKTYRYIRAIKTIATDSFTISELKVFGSITVNVKTNATANANGIAVKFNTAVPGLSQADFSLTKNGNPVTINAVSSVVGGTVYNLNVSDIKAGDAFYLNITKSGYEFESNITFNALEIIDVTKHKVGITASATQTGYEFEKAVDQNIDTFWNMGSVAGVNHYLQIELPAAYAIQRVELDGYKGTNQNIIDTLSYRQSFEIRASNDPTFATYEVLGEQGITAFDITKPWSVNAASTVPYKYIRFQKTVANGVLISELRVFVAKDNSSMLKSVKFANGTDVRGATSVPIVGNELIVSFFDHVNFDTVTEQNIQLKKADTKINCIVSIDNAAKVFKLTPNEKLEYLTDYEVVISNVEDIYGMKMITPVVCRFTSVDMKYKISFWNDTEKITTLTGQTKAKAKADIIKTAQDGETYVLIFTLYNGELMEKAVSKTVSLTENCTYSFETDMMIFPQGLDLSKCRLRAFIWNSFGEMISISETTMLSK